MRLRRYPVKSMLGEDISHSYVDAAGLACDRRLALVHTGTGKVASAKNPRTWRALLTLSAAVTAENQVRITFPDGAVIMSTDLDADARLTRFAGQPVTLTATPPPEATLERAVPDEVLRSGVTAEVPVEISHIAGHSPAGTFFDFSAVHLITSSTLDSIASRSPHGSADLERYRPNIVVSTPAADGFPENDWYGRDLRIGRDLMLRVVARTPRCAMPTLQHGSLPRDPDALRVLANYNRVAAFDGRRLEPCAGVYAQVISPGWISQGDHVEFA
jgi:uncharacterized protein